MTKKRKVRIFFCGDAGEVNADVSVEPTVTVHEQESSNRLLRIGGGNLELTLPAEIYDQIKGL